MCIHHGFLHIFDRKLSIKKMDAHRYRDNVSYVVNYYREYLRDVSSSFNIVSMGTDHYVPRFFFIEANVKVYYRAGKRWKNASILVTEKTHYSLFGDS